MPNSPKISIITPSFNQANYLEQTIQSVINQGYPNYELIIMDGGSSDHSVDIIKKYADYISYWVSEKDEGQADAIQKGLTKATGDIFNWINSDDYLEPGALQTIGDFFVQNQNKQALCGFTRCFYDENNETSHIYRMGLQNTTTQTMLNIAMNQPGTFYRTEALRKIGGINKTLRYVFDNELWFRFLNYYGVKSVGTTNALLAQFRLHGSSKSVYEGYALFDKESKAIWHWLAKTYNFIPSIQNFLAEEPKSNNYQSALWAGNYLQLNELQDYWCFYYMLRLMQQQEFNNARKGFQYGLKHGLLSFNRKNISIAFHLYFYPGLLKQ